MSFEIRKIIDAMQEDTRVSSAPEPPEITDETLGLEDTNIVDLFPMSYLDIRDEWEHKVNRRFTVLSDAEERARESFLNYFNRYVDYDPPSSLVQPVENSGTYGTEDFRAEIKAMRVWDDIESYRLPDGKSLTGEPMYWSVPQQLNIICDETPPEITEMIIRLAAE